LKNYKSYPLKKKYIINILFFTVILSALLYTGCSKNILKNYEREYRIPNAVFITSGDGRLPGSIPQGAVLAIQYLKKQGVNVMLDNRDLLLKPNDLAKYDIMIILTALNYHDTDRKYSLTYISDIGLQNIKDWIQAGGYLIAGDNIGRNTYEGRDRTTTGNGMLDSVSWLLAPCFGVNLIERNISGYELTGINSELWNETIRPASTEEDWGLTINAVNSEKVKVLAELRNGNDKIPAMTENEYGKGKALLLPTSYLLHPANDGGLSSVEKIEKFYNYIVRSYFKERKFDIQLNPWPYGYSSAFCMTFNASGTKEQYERIMSLLKEQKIPATFFIDTTISRDIYEMINDNKDINIESNSYAKIDFTGLDYQETKRQLLMNQNYWKRQFRGIRFPFTRPNNWGYFIASSLGYIFDSSIGVEYLTSFKGSVFPYNIPATGEGVFQALEMIELSPVQNDDYYFYQNSLSGNYSTDMQQKDAQLYGEYLISFYKYAVEQNNGMMVYMGHPLYSGYSEATLSPLRMLISKLKEDNCLITTLEDIADHTQKINKLSISVKESGNSSELTIHLPDHVKIEGLTFRLKNKPSEINGELQNQKSKELNGVYYISFDAENGNVIELF
jgi:peptidoglycan/xylan/chitin deacetylase (PgdA/CDA1 family)